MASASSGAVGGTGFVLATIGSAVGLGNISPMSPVRTAAVPS